MSKKIIIFLLILTLTLFLSSCDDNRTPGPNLSNHQGLPTDQPTDVTNPGTDWTDTNTEHIEDTGTQTPIQSGFGCTVTGGGSRLGYAVMALDMCGVNYNVQTNPWGGARQEIEAGNGKVFEVLNFEEKEGALSWDVGAFPAVYRGVIHGGASPTQNSGLPKMIADINGIHTGLSTNALSIPYGGNTTYDVYFTDTAEFNSGQPHNYLMVWFHSSDNFNPIIDQGAGYNCSSLDPKYNNACTDREWVLIRGKYFVRFWGHNGPSGVISYVPTERFEHWEFDLKEFIDDAIGQGVLTPNMYLQSIQAGFEITRLGIGLRVNDFYANIF